MPCHYGRLPDPGHRNPDSEIAIWQARFEPEAQLTLPTTADSETVRSMYVIAGAVGVGGTTLPAPIGAVLRTDSPLKVTAGSEGAEILILQGRLIGEPVAQYGPFVMNDRARIEQAFSDLPANWLRRGPWPTDDPVHPADSGRFAVHPDGHSEHPDD